MDLARILAYVTWTVDQELLARNEYLAAENRILKAQLNGRPRLSDAERGVLGEIGHRVGRKVLADIVTVARKAARISRLARIVPSPGPCSRGSAGNIVAFPQVGGLHHRYERRAA